MSLELPALVLTGSKLAPKGVLHLAGGGSPSRKACGGEGCLQIARRTRLQSRGIREAAGREGQGLEGAEPRVKVQVLAGLWVREGGEWGKVRGWVWGWWWSWEASTELHSEDW